MKGLLEELTSGYPVGSMKSNGTTLFTLSIPCFSPVRGGVGFAAYSVNENVCRPGACGVDEPLVPLGVSIFASNIYNKMRIYEAVLQ